MLPRSQRKEQKDCQNDGMIGMLKIEKAMKNGRKNG